MNEETLLQHAEALFEAAKAMDPTITKLTISFSTDVPSAATIQQKSNAANQLSIAGNCVFIPGIGIVCF